MSSILGRSSILITGLEGSGKSHFIMSQVKAILDTVDNEYDIYLSNIDGVTLEHPMLHIVDTDFSWVADAPANSIVIYDEAGSIDRFSNAHTKINSHNDVESLTKRRHKNVLTVFVAQDCKLLHSGLRSLIKYHYHFSNPYSSNDKTHCFITAGVNQRGDKTVVEEFDHILDPSIFPLYKSVDSGVKHDKKPVKNKKAQLMFRIAIASIIFAIPIFIGLFFMIKKVYNDNFNADNVNQKINSVSDVADTVASKDDVSSDLNTINNSGSLQLEQNNLQAKRTLELYKERLPDDYQILSNNDDLCIASVINFGGVCTAYNIYGEQLNVSNSKCLYHLDRPIKCGKNRQNIITENAQQPQPQQEAQPQQQQQQSVTGELATNPLDFSVNSSS